MKKKMYWVVALVSISIVEAQPPSLVNIGNSCYMNALLQAMFNIPQLNALVLKYSTGGNTFGGVFLPAYIPLVGAVVAKKPVERDLLEKFHRGFENALKPSYVKTALEELNNSVACPDCIDVKTSQEKLEKEFKKIIEEEKTKDEAAQEKYIIEYFEDQLKKVPLLKDAGDIITLLTNVPQGFAEKTLITYSQQDSGELYGKLIGEFLDEANAAKMFIEGVRPLFEVIYFKDLKDTGFFNFMRPLFIASIKLNRRLEDVLTQFKAFLFADGEVRAPKVLVLSLDPAPSAACTNCFLTIPEQLDMEPYHKVFKGLTYDLVSVVIWSGGLGSVSSGGHYTAYVNDLYADDTCWYYCDDSTIEFIGKELRKEDYVRINTRSRLLFYMQTSEVNRLQPKQGQRRQLAALSGSLAALAGTVQKK